MKTNRRASAILLFALALTGCDRSLSPLPSAPSAVMPAPVMNPPAQFGYVPGITLSGVVSEITASGLKPLEGATIYCDACGEEGHSRAYTSSSGSYTFTEGLWTTGGPTLLHIEKEGYDDPSGLPRLLNRGVTGPGWREVMIKGDTQFDMQLVRK